MVLNARCEICVRQNGTANYCHQAYFAYYTLCLFRLFIGLVFNVMSTHINHIVKGCPGTYYNLTGSIQPIYSLQQIHPGASIPIQADEKLEDNINLIIRDFRQSHVNYLRLSDSVFAIEQKACELLGTASCTACSGMN